MESADYVRFAFASSRKSAFDDHDLYAGLGATLSLASLKG